MKELCQGAFFCRMAVDSIGLRIIRVFGMGCAEMLLT